MLPEFKFHHIGIATNSINNTAQSYSVLGYTMSGKIYDPIQNVSIAFIEKIGMPRIELVEPGLTTHNCPVSKIIKNMGVSPYHICYGVDNLETAIDKLKMKKYLLLAQPIAAIAIDNKKICFLYNVEVGLIELVECEI